MRKRLTINECMIFTYLNGRHIVRCGNTICVGPKGTLELDSQGDFDLPEGTYNADEIDLPDELLAPGEKNDK